MALPINTIPLEKSFRTGEGILVYASNVILAVTAVLPHGLSWTHAGLYLTILNAVHVISRSLLKASAVQQGLGIGAPIDFDPLDPSVIAGVATDIVGTGVLGENLDLPPEAAAKPETGVKPDGGDANQDGAAPPTLPAGE